VQGKQAIRGPTTAAPGSTIEIEIGSGAKSVDIDFGGPDGPETFEVPPGQKLTIPLPPTAGQWVTITVGTGLDLKTHLIEIISTNPPS
jgi:hypothetical protein